MLSLLPSTPSVRHIMGRPCVCVTSCRYPMSVRQIMGTPLCQCITSWGHPRVYASYHGIPLCRCITSWGHACVCITSCGHPETVRCEMRRRLWGRWLQTKNFYTLIRSGLASLCILLRGNSFRLRAIIYMMEGRKSVLVFHIDERLLVKQVFLLWPTRAWSLPLFETSSLHAPPPNKSNRQFCSVL